MATCPSIAPYRANHRIGAMPPHLRSPLSLCATIALQLLIFTRQPDCNVEVDNLQTPVVVNDQIIGFDISMGNKVLVKERQASDKPPEHIWDLVANGTSIEGNGKPDWGQAGHNEPQMRTHFKRVDHRNDVRATGIGPFMKESDNCDLL